MIQVVKSSRHFERLHKTLLLVVTKQCFWFQGIVLLTIRINSRVMANLKTLPVGSLGITNDIPCLAEKYCREYAVTDNYTESNDTEEDYISIVDIFSRTGGGDVSC